MTTTKGVHFEPLKNFVVLDLEPEGATSSIIQVVGELASRVRVGRVLVVGPECREVRPGQRVWASITAGVELAETSMLVPESAILAFDAD